MEKVSTKMFSRVGAPITVEIMPFSLRVKTLAFANDDELCDDA